jgi:RHS repeat-associated protein
VTGLRRTRGSRPPTRTPGSNLSAHEHRTLYAYDSRHRLTTITHHLCDTENDPSCASPTATGSNTYSYDDNDNRTRVSESNGAGSSDHYYCYDALNRLRYRTTAADCSGTTNETYVYDAAGNRTQADINAIATYFNYSSSGQLCEDWTSQRACAADSSTWEIQYDSAGRTAVYNGFVYEYDAEGRLTRACKSTSCSGTIDKITFTYDGQGRRTQIKVTYAAGGETKIDFRYQGDAVVEEYRDDVLDRRFVVDESGAIIKVIVVTGTDAGTYLVTWNGHGDAMALHRINTNGTLTLANSYTYSTWGAPTTATHNSISDLEFRYLYVGAHGVQWDNYLGLGLHYMRTRNYSPNLGRFIQPDPSRLDSNYFGYADSNPASMIDPDGRLPFVLVAVAVLALRIAPVVTRAAAGTMVVSSSPVVQRQGQQLLGAISRVPAPQLGVQIGRIVHITDRHAAWSQAPNTSKFFPQYFKFQQPTEWLISGATKFYQGFGRVVSGHSSYTIETFAKFPYYVGYTQQGRPTQWVTFVWKNGYLWTAHPGFPTRMSPGR